MRLEVERSAVVAWNPSLANAGILAAGTVAGTMGADFDYSAHLELFRVDMNPQEDGQPKQLQLLGATSASERFHKLTWGLSGAQSGGSYSLGLLAGGLSNGSVSIWDPKKIMDGEEDSLVVNVEHGKGPVQGLEFNPFQPNLLASGGSNSEINIWDIVNAKAPSVFNPSSKSTNQDVDITCVAWNRKVSHILGSTNYNGVTNIWDLKAKRSVLNFSDPNKRIRCRSMAWNPDEATQLIVASEDDATPVIEIWDLRNTVVPVRELSGHSKGIWAISWCPQDADLLLSTSKDHKTLCWNLKSGEVQSEVDHGSTSWNFDVQWSPKIPALLSTCSFSGKIKVVSLQDTRSNEARDDTSVSLFDRSKSAHAPKWLKRPAGVNFGFGGKLASFNRNDKSQVKLQQVVTDEGLVSSAEKVKELLSTGVNEEVEKLCKDKSKEQNDSWSIMAALFADNQRKRILENLGYTPKKNKTVEEESADEILRDKEETSDEDSDISFPEDEEEAAICLAVITGDVEEAVDLCLSANRMADALLIAAYAKDQDVWNKAQKAHFKQQRGTYLSLLAPVMNKDYSTLVDRCNLKDWKTVLATLCTYAQSDEFPLLVSKLGDRLREEEKEGATCCYICAGNMDKATQMWTLDVAKGTELQEFVEKVIVLKKATNYNQPLDQKVTEKFSDYASYLASQGKRTEALQILSFLLGSQNAHKDETAAGQLLERLIHSTAAPAPQRTITPTLAPRVNQLPAAQTSVRTAPPTTPFVPQTGYAPAPGPVSSGPPSRFPTPVGGQQQVPANNYQQVPANNYQQIPANNYQQVPANSNHSYTPTTPLSHPPTNHVTAPKLPSPVSIRQVPITNAQHVGGFKSGAAVPTIAPPLVLPTPTNPVLPTAPVSAGPPPTMEGFSKVIAQPGVVTKHAAAVPAVPTGNFVPPTVVSHTSHTTHTASSMAPPPTNFPVSAPPTNYPVAQPVVQPPPVSTFVPTAPAVVSQQGPTHTGFPQQGPPPTTPLAPPPTTGGSPSLTNNTFGSNPPSSSPAAPSKSAPGPTTAENQYTIDSLRAIFEGSSRSQNPKVQKLEKDVSKRFEPFIEKLKKNEVSAPVSTQSKALVEAILAGDHSGSNATLSSLTTNHWEELGSSMVIAFKRMVEMTKP
ncbi:protein transport protein SEC31 isoform 1 [Planoprotostelium fungivorum]|uniref:Protein transport protein SEC31 isoform 1 n=1 Tax=Planoprotostelium fungivorum TaxID=1890364 RepID=A0A2P6MYH1_9EUKA|nr:protein transport protein SEC31 isoform 1 [Planoprotostelium fungivorum]